MHMWSLPCPQVVPPFLSLQVCHRCLEFRVYPVDREKQIMWQLIRCSFLVRNSLAILVFLVLLCFLAHPLVLSNPVRNIT